MGTLKLTDLCNVKCKVMCAAVKTSGGASEEEMKAPRLLPAAELDPVFPWFECVTSKFKCGPWDNVDW